MGKASRKKKTRDSAFDGITPASGTSLFKSNVLLGALIPLLLITIVGVLVYSNTLKSPFQLDDNYLIGDNFTIKDFSYFLEPSTAKGSPFYSALVGRYVGYLTFALNYKMHGLNVYGYHIVNIAIHILNGLLVYLLILLTFKTPFLMESSLKKHSGLIAMFSSLLFVSHPVQTEAVTYIFQRLASLATSFYLLSLVCYIKYRELSAFTNRRRESGKQPSADKKNNIKTIFFYVLSLISCILAMKTKENAYTLPLVIAVYEFSFFESPLKQRIRHLLPLLLTLLIIPVTLIGTDKPVVSMITGMADVTRGDISISRSDYLFTQFRVIVTYIRLLFFPIDQTFDYDYPVFHSFFNKDVFLSFLFLLSIFVSGIYLFYRSRVTDYALRLVAFGIFWFFITLTVESSIVPIPMIICEYRVYLPSAGPFISIVTGAFLLIGIVDEKRTKIITASLFVPLLIIFSIAAYARNTVWDNRISLWEDVVKKAPKKERGHTNLANAYKTEGMADKAKKHFEIAVNLKPDSAKANYNLAVTLWSEGSENKAMEYYKEALRLAPNYAEAHNNLGVAYKTRGMTEKAIEHYEAALKLRPGYIEAHNNLGDAYSSKKLFEKAAEQYKAALSIDPNFAEAHNNLGTAYRSRGITDKAVEHYMTAIRLKPDMLEAHYNLGYIYFEKKDMANARREFQAVLRIKPDMKYARQLIEFIDTTKNKK